MILDDIVEATKTTLAIRKERCSVSELEDIIKKRIVFCDFRSALSEKHPAGLNIIAELKKASPSRGVIRETCDPVAIATAYQDNGAAAISVLTEESFFLGSMQNLSAVRRRVSLPLLRKDFVIDPYQVYESCACGADAVLLIVAILDPGLLADLMQLARELRLDTLVEVHSAGELHLALEAEAAIVGINNRNLRTFKTDIDTTLQLLPDVPHGCVTVSESGIAAAADIRKLSNAGVQAFLIGETLMRAHDPGKKLAELVAATDAGNNIGDA